MGFSQSVTPVLSSHYIYFRDQYLAHVKSCGVCRRVWVSYWDRETGSLVEYWTVWRGCGERSELLGKIAGLF